MAGAVSAIVDIPSKTFREYARRVLVTAAYNAGAVPRRGSDVGTSPLLGGSEIGGKP